MARQYVVIGVSAAGIGSVSKLRQLDPDATIIALSYESELPYNKCFLADYVSNAKTKEQVLTKPTSFFADNRIDLRLGVSVTHIDRHNKIVTCANSTTLPYDALLLGVGGSARALPVKGSAQVQGIFSFYTYGQTEALKLWAERSSTETIVIVGAGLSGLECADALLGYNKKIIIIDRAASVLPSHTTVASARYLQDRIAATGIQTFFNSGVQEVISKNGVITGIHLVDGTVLDASMLVWAIGAQPNTELAHAAGITLEQGAIATNHFLQTNDPSIFAAGDCALVNNRSTGQALRSTTWPDAMMQGMIAAEGMVGKPRAYSGIVPWLSSAFFGQKFYAAGRLQPMHDEQIIEQLTDDGYIFIIKNADGVVQGFTMVGAVACYAVDLKRSLVSQSIYQGALSA